MEFTQDLGGSLKCYIAIIFNWTYLNASVTLNTFAFINPRIFKTFLVFNHRYYVSGTNRITSCTSAAFFFSAEQNWNFIL